MVVAFIIGVCLGLALYTSKICFANSFLQTIYLKDRRGLLNIFLILLVTTIAILVVQLIMQMAGLPLPSGRWQVGVPTFVGAFLFGIGMTLSGSCTGTALVRIGEGTKIYLLVALGIIIGLNLGDAHHLTWWNNSLFTINKPLWQLIPWWSAALFQLAVISTCYLLLKGVKTYEKL